MRADHKESVKRGQDADSVSLLDREEYYLEKVKPKSGEKLQGGKDAFEEWERDMFACRGKLDLIIAKNRHDKSTTKTVKFLPEYSAVRSGGFNEMDVEERSEEHTSELQSLMRISYAVFCLKKKNKYKIN